MTPTLSPNTQAILLLTAPLIAGRGSGSPDSLTPGEYKRLARQLREMQRQPADLLSPDSVDLVRDCRAVVEESRLRRLLERGFALSQALERWQARAIWVVSRADASYPQRLKARLREDAPAVLYGCGEIGLLETGGLAVVGSRHVDDDLIEYTMSVGRLAARAGMTLVSGGARGIDQAAMRGALESGGAASGVLADSLETACMNRDYRDLLMEGNLVLTSAYDPSAGFNVGNAMQRNKLIYALADAALVVSSDLNKGGTWAGATEQLDKLRLVPVYVRSTGQTSEGLEALRKKGAMPWPEPQDVDELRVVLDAATTASPKEMQGELVASVSSVVPPGSTSGPPDAAPANPCVYQGIADVILPPASFRKEPEVAQRELEAPVLAHEAEVVYGAGQTAETADLGLADASFEDVRETVVRLLETPMGASEVATALGMTNIRAKDLLSRMVEEKWITRSGKPSVYRANAQMFLPPPD
jgi:predicted Rossmann fold nucleotide-binding protein DprA/Smf involved in DNA uptake